MFRDHHITEEAYRLGLDKNILAIHNEEKWQDYIKSITLNKSLGEKLEKASSPSDYLIKLNSLQIKYSDNIRIDTDKFDQIQLSSIDMSVMYTNQPYAKLEPNFPIITNDHLLDYGQKNSILMNKFFLFNYHSFFYSCEQENEVKNQVMMYMAARIVKQ